MSKFKVGDRVRRVGKPHTAGIFPVGMEGVVTSSFSDNRYVLDGDDRYSHDPDFLELVEEKGPVRTKTIKEIVPGIYGNILVATMAGRPHIRMGLDDTGKIYSAEDLTHAIEIFTSIRDALRDNEQ